MRKKWLQLWRHQTIGPTLGNHGTGRPFLWLVSVPECVWISFSLPKSTGRNDIKLGSNCVPIRNDDWERAHVLQRSCIRNHQLGVYLLWGPLWRARGCGRYDTMIYICIYVYINVCVSDRMSKSTSDNSWYMPDRMSECPTRRHGHPSQRFCFSPRICGLRRPTGNWMGCCGIQWPQLNILNHHQNHHSYGWDSNHPQSW